MGKGQAFAGMTEKISPHHRGGGYIKGRTIEILRLRLRSGPAGQEGRSEKGERKRWSSAIQTNRRIDKAGQAVFFHIFSIFFLIFDL